MSSKTLGLAITLLSSSAFSQINVDQDAGGGAAFTSRGIAGNQNGWAFNGYKYDRQGGGIGLGGLQGWSTIMQDQNCSTIATFQFAILEGGVDNTGAPVANDGDPFQWPDPSKLALAMTAPLLAPAGGNGPCAWAFTTTLATPIDGASLTSDLFTATYLPSNSMWTADGASSHISIAQPSANGTGREYPNQSPTAAPEVGSEFGINWVGGSVGSNGSITGGTPSIPGSPRFWLNRLRYNHSGRAGVDDTTRVFPSFGAVSPNYGMAGSYPDPLNRSGLSWPRPRADELRWCDVEANNFGVGTAIGQVLLSTRTLRDLGQPGGLALPGIGVLELDPSDPLFSAGSALGLVANPIVGTGLGGQAYLPSAPLAQSPGGRRALGLWWASTGGQPLNLYAQIVRVNFASSPPSASLSSLDSHSLLR